MLLKTALVPAALALLLAASHAPAAARAARDGGRGLLAAQQAQEEVKGGCGSLCLCTHRATSMKGDELTTTCYAGHFLFKMLGELNSGEAKTTAHVRSNLLPYLGGQAGIDALEDPVQHDALTQLRAELTLGQLDRYDELTVCSKELGERILEALPHNDTNILVSRAYRGRPFRQILSLLKVLYGNPAYDGARSCRRTGAPAADAARTRLEPA